MAVTDRYLTPQMDPQRILNVILWPLAVMTMFHRSFILAVNGHRTDDWAPVYDAALDYLNQRPVYDGDYTSVDPHYLYPPSGTLLMSPFAVFDPDTSRWIFIAGSVIALIICAYLLCRMFGYRASSWVFPATLLFMFLTESVTNTLTFTNSNAFVLFGMIAFLTLLRSGNVWWAGVAIGITLAVKPVLAPLLLLPLLNRQWKAIITAVAVPLVLNAAAWPYANDPMAFVTRTAPYLFETRNYYNSSIAGMGLYLGVAPWLVILLRIAFLAMGIFSLWFLYRYYRRDNQVLWLTTSSGVLLLTTFLCGSLGQGYYSMLLFPLLMTVFVAGSTIRNWPAWLGIYGCFTYDGFGWKRFEPLGRWMEYTKVTWGWSLLMVAVFCVLLFRWLDVRNSGDTPDGAHPDVNPDDAAGPPPHAGRATVDA